MITVNNETKLKIIRVGSRASRLAVIQSEIVMRMIEESSPEIVTDLVTMTTTGDRILDKTLDQIGGKGLFVRELDEALRSGAVDITVHSLKDLPKDIPEELPVAAYSVREDPRDVLVLPQGRTEIDTSLPVGTSSLRRSLQFRELYPGIETAPVRGNVETRLRKLDEGQYSGLIMAAAGLIRLGLEDRISRFLSPEEMIPASCQGILGIQTRSDDRELAAILAEAVNSRTSELAAAAERAFVKAIGADCGSPDTAFSWIDGEVMHIRGFRADPADGALKRAELSCSVCISGSTYGTDDAELLGKKLAEMLIGS
jgi:hydroxymethylbilane synthase